MANEPSSPASASPANPASPALGPQARGEARVFDLSKLLPSQREAVRSAQDLVARMAEKTYSPRPRRSHEDLATALRVNIDPDRESRALLLDGPRGSGKTSALLTLLQGWGDSSLLSRSAPGTGYASPEPSPASPETISNPRGRIVPVGIIDLQPLADGTNLLQLIASHFAHIVDAIDGIGSHSDAPPSLAAAWQGGLSREPESRRLWRKLIATIAGGFDRSLQGRAAQLDLEAYALEFEQQGRHRLDLDVFYDFIEALLGDLCTRLGRNRSEAPLFVLAIDDADMAPQRSVELLWTVRALWHPRCVFILTGHSDLFQLQLRQHYIGELLRPIGHRPVPSQDQDEIARHATTMASEAYEKIIPPNQRLLIRPLEPSQRLTWPLQRGSRSDGKTSTLLQLLGQIRVPTYSSEPLTLADYFQIDDETTAQLAEALPERPRRLLDLSLQLEALAARQKAAPRSEPGQATPDELRPTSEAVLAIWETALLSTDPIRFDKLRRQVRLDPKTGALIVGTTDPRQQLEGPLTPELQLVRELDAYPVPETGGKISVQILKLARLSARLVSRQALPTGAEAKLIVEQEYAGDLPSEVVAALRLSVNVAADQRFGRREAVSWVPTDAGLQTWMAAGTYADTRRKLRFSWPLPDDIAFVDLAVLDLRWKRRLKHLPNSDRRCYGLAFISTILGTYAENHLINQKAYEPLTDASVIQSINHINQEIIHSKNRRLETVINWITTRYPLLYSPESGIADFMFEKLSPPLGDPSIVASLANILKYRDQRTLKAQILRGSALRDEELRTLHGIIDSISDHWRRFAGEQIAFKSQLQEGLRKILQDLGIWDNLLPYEMNDMLRELAKLKLWYTELQPFQHSRPLQVISLWRSVCIAMNRTDLAPNIQVSNSKLAIRHIDDAFTYKPSGSKNSRVLEIRFSPAISSCGYIHIVSSRVLHSLYTAIWDAFSEKTAGSPPIVSGIFWPGYSSKIDPSREFRTNMWPNIQFKQYKLAKTLVVEWHMLFSTIPFDNEAIPSQQWVDMLAYWFIESQVALVLLQPLPQPQALIDAAAWRKMFFEVKQMIAATAEPPPNGSPTSNWHHPESRFHHDALESWWSLIPLFASPESGLSHEAVNGIASSLFTNLDSKSIAEELKRIQDLRIYRLLAAEEVKLDHVAAKTLLSEIDAANPDHPYVALLRQHGVSL